MIKLLLLSALIVATFGAPQYSPYYRAPGGRQFAILRFDNDIYPDGSYTYGYDTENGISAQESGQQRAVGGGNYGSAVRGSYQYTSPEGQLVQIQYIADENGFQPTGNVIPNSRSYYNARLPYRNY